MTLGAVFAHAVLATLLLGLGRMQGHARERMVVRVAVAGASVALATIVFRLDLDPWRGVVLEPGPLALVAAALACSWALVAALDLGDDRTWIGALVGVAGTALLLFAGSRWSAPGLIFWLASSAALGVGLARTNRLSWALVGVSDLALVAAVWLEHLDSESWLLPVELAGASAVVVAVVVVGRCGVIPFAGGNALVGTPAAPLIPLLGAGGFLITLRMLDRPVPLVGAGVLALAIAVGVVALWRKALDPGLVASWPALVGLGLILSSTSAGTIAALASILGLSAAVLWPVSRGRGHLARGFLLTGVLPNLMFAAIAVTAVGAFERSTVSASALEGAAWIAVASLLPAVIGMGLALGVAVARSEKVGGYQPEAVFVTWLLLAGSVTAGLLLGPGEVYSGLGGGPAVALFGVALAIGAFVARSAGTSVPSLSDLKPFYLGSRFDLPRAGLVLGLGLQVIAATGVLWFTFRGLKAGFL